MEGKYSEDVKFCIGRSMLDILPCGILTMTHFCHVDLSKF